MGIERGVLRRWWWWWWRRRLLAVLLLAATAFVGLTAWLFVWPASAAPERADAVVVFAGGREARMLAALAARSGWDSLVLVTSAYHLRRATLLLRRCYQGSVHAVAARPRLTPSLVGAIAHEWLGLADALAVQRRC